MSKGTRYTWMAALVALALGWGELVAYQNLTGQALLASDRSRAVLRAGEVVARNLSAIVFAGAEQAAGAVVLQAVKGTSQLYRLAQGATGETGACTFTAFRCARAAGARVNPARGPDAVRVRRAAAGEAAAALASESGAVVASRSDARRPTSRARNADLVSGLGCPACPSCPAGPVCKDASSAGAPSGRAGVARARVIVKV